MAKCQTATQLKMAKSDSLLSAETVTSLGTLGVLGLPVPPQRVDHRVDRLAVGLRISCYALGKPCSYGLPKPVPFIKTNFRSVKRIHGLKAPSRLGPGVSPCAAGSCGDFSEANFSETDPGSNRQ